MNFVPCFSAFLRRQGTNWKRTPVLFIGLINFRKYQYQALLIKEQSIHLLLLELCHRSLETNHILIVIIRGSKAITMETEFMT